MFAFSSDKKFDILGEMILENREILQRTRTVEEIVADHELHMRTVESLIAQYGPQ